MSGRNVSKHKVGDRVVVPFVIACGHCFYCEKHADRPVVKTQIRTGRSKPSHDGASDGRSLRLHPSCSAAFRAARRNSCGLCMPISARRKCRMALRRRKGTVPCRISSRPDGWRAKNCDIQPGDTVAVWGCGPVGQMAIQSAWLQGAGQVIAFDHVPERLEMAKTLGKATVFNFMEVRRLRRIEPPDQGTRPGLGDRLPSVRKRMVSAVSPDAVVDRVKAATGLGDRPPARLA